MKLWEGRVDGASENKWRKKLSLSTCDKSKVCPNDLRYVQIYFCGVFFGEVERKSKLWGIHIDGLNFLKAVGKWQSRWQGKVWEEWRKVSCCDLQ